MKWLQYNQQLRKTIKTGDLYFTASHAVIPWLIRLFTRAKISHVGMFVWIGNRLFAIESTAIYGCRMLPASQRLTEKFVLVHTHTKVTKNLLNLILRDVGRVKYNYWGVVVALFVRTRTHEKFCSEWIAKILKLKFSNITRGIQPNDIYEAYLA